MRYHRRSSGLYAPESPIELPRGTRGFMPAFGAPFQAPIATPGGGSISPIVVLDHFTDADDTLLTAHVPNVRPGSNAWVATSGTWKIASNKAYKSGDDAAYQIALIDSGISDGVITLTVNIVGVNGNPGIVFRATDDANYWGFYVTTYGGGAFLYKKVANSFSEAARFLFVPPAPSTHSLRVTLSGTSITCVCDTIYTVSATDSFNQTATKHGLWAYDTDDTFDDFQVSTV